MKTRLFNEYGAAITNEGNEIYLIMNRALADVGAYCKENNIDLRDAQLFCMTDVNIYFCGEILREATRLRKLKDSEELPKNHKKM